MINALLHHASQTDLNGKGCNVHALHVKLQRAFFKHAGAYRADKFLVEDDAHIVLLQLIFIDNVKGGYTERGGQRAYDHKVEV